MLDISRKSVKIKLGGLMRISSECGRKIFFEVEKIPQGEYITVENLYNQIGEYPLEEVIALVSMLSRERYIVMIDRAGYDENDLVRDNKIKGLSERGYRTLDLLRDEDVWNLMKEKTNNFNNISFFTTLYLANKIVNVKQNKMFNLPDNLFDNYTRW